MIYRFSRFICLVFCRIFLRLTVRGRECIPADGPFILAANHVSYLDPVVVGTATRRTLCFLAKEELFRVPLLGKWIRMVGVVPIRRDNADIRALKAALSALKSGRPVALFPEGRRHEVEKPKAGVGFLYRKSGVPVIAAHISGTERAFPPEAKMIRPCRVTVTFSRMDNIAPDDDYEAISRKVFIRIKS